MHGTRDGVQLLGLIQRTADEENARRVSLPRVFAAAIPICHSVTR
jgi:hypothetical protein